MLNLHAGGELIDYASLRALPTPEGTATHVPIAHHAVVDMVKYSLGFFGHEIIEEHHAIDKEGDRYFGLISLKSPYGDYVDTVGLRNSHDRTFPIGIAMGSKVFVCSNLAFHSDIVIKRKHTKGAKYALPSLVAEAIEPLAIQRQRQALTFNRYKGTPLQLDHVDAAIIKMYREGVINVTKIADVINAYDHPPHDWGGETAWRLFNAGTFALTGRVAENPKGTAKLHEIIDGTCERLAA